MTDLNESSLLDAIKALQDVPKVRPTHIIVTSEGIEYARGRAQMDAEFKSAMLARAETDAEYKRLLVDTGVWEEMEKS